MENSGLLRMPGQRWAFMWIEVSPPVGALSKRAGHPKRGYSLSLQVLLECKARGYKPRLPAEPER